MRILEKNFLILRYLNWRRPLIEHPDYQAALRSEILGGGRKVMKHHSDTVLKNYIEDEQRPEMDIVYTYLNKNWARYAEAFSYRVEVISKAFANQVAQAHYAFENSKQTLKDYFAGKTFKGTLLIPHLNASLSYDIEYKEDGNGFKRLILLQVSDGDCISVFTNGQMAFVTNTMSLVDVATGEKKRETRGESLTDTLNYLDTVLGFLIDYIAFKRFANVTEKFAARPRTKEEKKSDPEKDFINTTGITIRQMDATYYTTFIRSEGFPRRGHFRMQRFKSCGIWDHRLQWIDATYVSGYTRKAKKLITYE